jgi:hypothetical protein
MVLEKAALRKALPKRLEVPLEPRVVDLHCVQGVPGCVNALENRPEDVDFDEPKIPNDYVVLEKALLLFL